MPPLGNLLPGPNSKTQSSSEHWLSLLLFYPLYFSWTNSAISVSKLRNCHVYVKTWTCWVEHILDLSTWAFPQIQSRYSESLIPLDPSPHTPPLYTIGVKGTAVYLWMQTRNPRAALGHLLLSSSTQGSVHETSCTLQNFPLYPNTLHLKRSFMQTYLSAKSPDSQASTFCSNYTF